MISALRDSLGRKLPPPYIYFIKRLNILIDEMFHPDTPSCPFSLRAHQRSVGMGQLHHSLVHPRGFMQEKNHAAVKVTLLVI